MEKEIKNLKKYFQSTFSSKEIIIKKKRRFMCKKKIIHVKMTQDIPNIGKEITVIELDCYCGLLFLSKAAFSIQFTHEFLPNQVPNTPLKQTKQSVSSLLEKIGVRNLTMIM